jgi:hypothetical protein
VPVDLCAVALDEAVLLQRTHTAPARRSRQADALGQFGVRQARVGLQLAQDGDVEFVQIIHDLPILRKILSKSRVNAA